MLPRCGRAAHICGANYFFQIGFPAAIAFFKAFKFKQSCIMRIKTVNSSKATGQLRFFRFPLRFLLLFIVHSLQGAACPLHPSAELSQLDRILPVARILQPTRSYRFPVKCIKIASAACGAVSHRKIRSPNHTG